MLGLLAMVLAGCARDDTDHARGPTTVTSAPTSAPDPGDDASIETLTIAVERIDVDLDSPTAAVAVPGDGPGARTGLLVAERRGVVRFVDTGDWALSPSAPLIDVSADVSTDGERGLLGIALTTDTPPRLVLSYTNRAGDTRVDSYAVTQGHDTQGDGAAAGGTPLAVDATTRVELLAIDQPFTNHNGGHVEIGPDGFLYIGVGDGGSAGDPYGNAQNPATLLGKLLRLDPRADSPRTAVPDDNPFVGVPGARPEIWSTGLRNPWRFSFDPPTGDLWIADVGQDRFEEINRVTPRQGGAKGANFGWDLFEGHEPFSDADPAPAPFSDGPFVEAVHVYPHGPGCSVTGGRVYRGGAIPELVGRYLFSDYCDGTIRALDPQPDGTTPSHDLGVSVDQPIGFVEDGDGEQYVISLSRGLYRIIPGA